MKKIPSYLFEKFEELYARLKTEMKEGQVPSGDLLSQALARSSIKIFDTTEKYMTNERAFEGAHFISSVHGEEAYRVYFNEFSKKVYVDLNPTFDLPEVEYTALSLEILKSVLLTDPALRTSESL